MSGSPLEQFRIKPIFNLELAGFDVSFSNSSLMMIAAVSLVCLFMTLSVKKQAIVPGRWQNMAEMAYEFVASILRNNAGEDAKKFFPFIFSTFMFILFCNLLGLLPYSFTVTSHIAITFAIAAFIFIGVTIVAIINHKAKFIKFFLPDGVPVAMLPMIFFIELFAYLVRPVSLSVRLAANMLAGHAMLKVIAGFVVSLGFMFGWAPLLFLVVLTGFEVFVAVLQAYIFTILACVYLNDAVHMH